MNKLLCLSIIIFIKTEICITISQIMFGLEDKTYWHSSSQSTILSGPGRWAFPLEWNSLKALGFRPATWDTASTSFFCKDCSLRNVISSRGAMQPILPSKVPNNKAKRLVLSEPGAEPVRSEVDNICSLKNLVTCAPTWNSALERSFCPFQLSDIFGA